MLEVGQAFGQYLARESIAVSTAITPGQNGTIPFDVLVSEGLIVGGFPSHQFLPAGYHNHNVLQFGYQL